MFIREGRLFGTSVSVKRGTCISGCSVYVGADLMSARQRGTGPALKAVVGACF